MTTAITAVLIATIAATVAAMAWLKPETGSTADNAAGAVLALIGFPLGTALMLHQAWMEIALVTIVTWALTVGFTRGRERIIWTTAACSGTAILAWLTNSGRLG